MLFQVKKDYNKYLRGKMFFSTSCSTIGRSLKKLTNVIFLLSPGIFLGPAAPPFSFASFINASRAVYKKTK